MNANSNLREILISKNFDKTDRKNEENTEDTEDNIKFSNNFICSEIYSNTLNCHLSNEPQLSQINNLYFCCYHFDKSTIIYGLTIDENKTLSFPKIKTKMNINEKTTTREIIARIKIYTQICYGLKPNSLDSKGSLIYNNNCYYFFQIENDINSEKSKAVKPPREVIWASLHEICNIQKLAKPNIANNIVENNIIQPEIAIMFFEHPFLIP